MSSSINFSEDFKTSVPIKLYSSFNQLVDGFIFFHVFSWVFLFIIYALTIVLSNTDPRSISHGISIAATIVGTFSYLTLKQFLETKKFSMIQQLIEVTKNEYFNNKPASFSETYEFYKNLKTILEYQAQEKFFSNLGSSLLDKCRLAAFWKFYNFALTLIGKERLIAILNNIENNPSDLKTHTEYANSLLDHIYTYQVPQNLKLFFLASTLKKLESDDIKKRIKKLYYITIEELKILDNLAPNDPWTHAKLAECFKGLGDLKQELYYLEILKGLRPHDKEILFKLGEVYFFNQQYSDSIKVYEQLKIYDKDLANTLMRNYRLYQEDNLK